MTHITEEGQPIGMFYGFKVAGMVSEADMAGLAADDAVYAPTETASPKDMNCKGLPARYLNQFLCSRATFTSKM